jgi:hypothetical protein
MRTSTTDLVVVLALGWLLCVGGIVAACTQPIPRAGRVDTPTAVWCFGLSVVTTAGPRAALGCSEDPVLCRHVAGMARRHGAAFGIAAVDDCTGASVRRGQ